MTEFHEKRRGISQIVPSREYQKFGTPPESWKDNPTKVTTVCQVTSSQGNAYRLIGTSPLLNIGGPFSTRKVEVDCDLSIVPLRHFSSGSIYFGIDCPVVPPGIGYVLTSSNFQEAPVSSQNAHMDNYCPSPSSDSDLRGLGTTAIARSAPTNPVFDGSVAIAELLREGLPSLPDRAGNAGGQYLNVQFGVLPLVNDAKSLHKAATESVSILENLEVNSGKLIRRRRSLGEESSTTFSSQVGKYADFIGSGPLAYVADTGLHTVHTTTTTKRWFSGAFSYNLPKQGLRRRLALLDHQYGVKPGVDTAWNLMPYSWAVDYFSNVGDVLHNANAISSDGLIVVYGYVMETKETIVTHNWTGRLKIDNIWQTYSTQATVSGISKTRIAASPYGFDLSFVPSARQVANLAALGISRV